MRTREHLRDIVVVGRSCRLPGAASVEQLWHNLVEGRCSIGEIQPDRWVKERHGHPRPKEPGKSYVWAAGVLDDVWSFDPAAFGISPREAEQMDPQQRLVLELSWEALEDAGLTRSGIAGTDVGVFVGASSTDYQNIRSTDIAGSDAYTATGGALSIVSNRVSHVFDLRGPSFTVDTACSSSLVALNQAMESIRSGRIDTALVGGVNLLLSPFGFVLFSQASMLSPTGLCHSFDARANGYVRSEGGVVLVLTTLQRARDEGLPIHGRLVASGVNSDGRTNGIALPSRDSQAKLLRSVYAEADIRAADVAFVEAHGTGTAVGDPIEASTIGSVLARGRAEPLRIGSIKSNIGHLEPASGLAGVLKAMLALEHDLLPPSVNFETPNPDIAFDELNLEVCARATPLPRGDAPRYAGVNSFGFGGTNAHVVLADAPTTKAPKRRPAGTSDRFVLSAASRPALRDLARRYRDRLVSASSDEVHEVVAAAAHRRELMSERLVVEWRSPRDLMRKLETVADRNEDAVGVISGSVAEAKAPVAFVFSGNGSQWPGMGRTAYQTSRPFREAFDEVDAIFDEDFGWSVSEALFANDIGQRLQFTHISQPLIFAIQIAIARALGVEGLEPNFAIGHSVGEIAAAVVAGALPLRDAVHVIHARSRHQELARDRGRMAAIVGSSEQISDLIRDFPSVEIAARNAPRNFTVAGTTEDITALGAAAKKRRMAARQLDLLYPFHCGLIDPVRDPLLQDLAGLESTAPKIGMISTVTGDLVAQEPLDAAYWWRNVREPVDFHAAVEKAALLGARIFVEIGPRSVLLSNLTDTLEVTSLPFAVLGVLEKREDAADADPIRPAVAHAFVRGASVELERLVGPPPSRPVPLPSYAWQKRSFPVPETGEAVAFPLEVPWHRLIGTRARADAVEWSRELDLMALPELADHEVGGQAILPGSAFVEMALAVGRIWFESDRAEIIELDIHQPLVLERGRAKEVRARLSPNTSVLEILSRPRLSRSGWQVNATARLSLGGEPETGVHRDIPTGSMLDGASIYAAAEAVGLHYGPAFRLLRHVVRVGPQILLAELEESDPAFAYGIDPAQLDACFHGLFALLGETGAEGRGTAYIPVRFGHVQLLQPEARVARAKITILKADERSMVADFELLDADNRPVLTLQDARFQAARVTRLDLLADRALSLGSVVIDRGSLGRGGLSENLASGLRNAAQDLDLLAPGTEPDTTEQLLLDGWAGSASYEIVRRLYPTGEVPDAAIAERSAEVGVWLTHCLHALEADDLAERLEEGWRLAPASNLPPSETILRAIAEDHPHRAAELLLAATLMSAIDASAAEGEALALPPAIIEGYELGGASVRDAGEAIGRILDHAGAWAPRGPALRIVQVGYGPLSYALKRASIDHGCRLTILETDRRGLERAKLALGSEGEIAFVDSLEALPEAGFDLVVSAQRLHAVSGGSGLCELRRSLAAGGMLVALEPEPSQFRDLTLGPSNGWFGAPSSHGVPIGPLHTAGEWGDALANAGFGAVETTRVRTGRETCTLVLANAAEASESPASRRSIRIESGGASGGTELARTLATACCKAGHQIDRAGPDDPETSAKIVVVVLSPDALPANDLDVLRDRCLALKQVAERCCRTKAECWILVEGARGARPLADPVNAGLVAFSRTLANEYPGFAVRRVAVASDTPAADAARTMAALLGTPQMETDFLIDAEGCRVFRVERLADRRPGEGDALPATRLERGATGGLNGLAWTGIDRPPPRDDEIEIAVEASGLNFRDVMWAMSLLPDDILEDGFAGPTLGLECAGRITRVGPRATRFRAGDRVLAFAPSAFSSFVCVPENVAAPVPPGVDLEAAATIPVTFLTAYYGLVTLANLKAGEWVLIHGAAGGVGLAAVQIAQARGATVVATAGSPEKRELLRSLGVEHVLNSRSAEFVDAIRRMRPKGVDVVLNSLSGELMERGLATLSAFGRFVELGKRDYVANTRIGLRPFRRNLSYFGVDVDQLLFDRDRAAEIFAEVIGLVESGQLRPLPYRVYSADETVDAFRLMQQSGHVGKILLRPRREPAPAAAAAPVRFDPDRTHLLTGGFGGFGLETARWLADKGVRHLVLAGRSGAKSEEAAALVAELEARGVRVLAAACDVADETSLRGLFGTVAQTMPPLAGILHAAMVLDDGLVASLGAEQLDRVLTPKVRGAALLDRLSAEHDLDYFILFSSITTVVGNPGQAAYVAANGYLEGLARRRWEQGRPALALAWGAISDVGILARQKGLAESLSKRVGVKGMPAREALDLMAQAMARPQHTADDAVIAVGSLDWSAARRLPALSSPSFAALVGEGSVADTAERQTIDLAGLVAAEGPEAARKQVVGVIVEEIATVLRVPRDDVSQTKRLAELGLDSLMAIELATALQDRFELETTMTGSVGAMTVGALADHLMASVHIGAPDEEARVSQTLNERHAGVELDASTLAPILEAVNANVRNLEGLAR